MTAPLVSLALLVLAWFAIAPRTRPWVVLGRFGQAAAHGGSVRNLRERLQLGCRRRRGLHGQSRPDVDDVNASDVRSDDVPIVADLLAVAVSAGVPVQQALIDVAAVMRGRGGATPVVTGGDRLERGAELAAVLDTMAQAGVGWHSLATQLSLSVDSGVSVHGALRRLAAQERLRIRRERERRARRLPVLLLLPLTTMVLPAFMLVTVVPFVVAGGISLELPQSDQSEMGNHD